MITVILVGHVHVCDPLHGSNHVIVHTCRLAIVLFVLCLGCPLDCLRCVLDLWRGACLATEMQHMCRGRLCREYPGSDRAVQRVHIATKLAAYPWRVTPWNMTAACKGSARRLGLDCISLGQLHWSAAKYAPLQVGNSLIGFVGC
jgi:hypothetical protein